MVKIYLFSRTSSSYSGGVADFSAHESVGDGHVESLRAPSGGKWGGANVDGGFVALLEMLFGTDELKGFIYGYTSEWLRFLRKYEATLQMSQANAGICLDIPLRLIDLSREAGKSMVQSQTIGGHFSLDGTRLTIDEQITESLYQYTMNSLCNEIDRLANIGVVADETITHVVVTGGMAASRIVKDRLQEQLKRYTLLFPNSGSSFALKGAVLLGYNKSLINSRIMPLTYALHNAVQFDETRHKDGATKDINGKKICTENVHPLIKIGTKVKPGTELSEIDMPLRATDKEHYVHVVSCGMVAELPSLVTHCCIHRETTFTIPLPFGCQVKDKIFDRVTVVGETELSFKFKFKKGDDETYIRYLEYK